MYLLTIRSNCHFRPGGPTRRHKQGDEMRRRHGRRGLSEILGSFIILLAIVSVSASVMYAADRYASIIKSESVQAAQRISDELNPPIVSLVMRNNSLAVEKYSDNIKYLLIYFIQNNTIKQIKINKKEQIIIKKYRCIPLKIYIVTQNGAIIPYSVERDPLHKDTRIRGDPSLITCNLFTNITNKNNIGLKYIYNLLKRNKIYYITSMNNLKFINNYINKKYKIVIKSASELTASFSKNHIGKIYVKINNNTYTIPPGGGEVTALKINNTKIIIGSYKGQGVSIIYLRAETSHGNPVLLSGSAALKLTVSNLLNGRAYIDGLPRNTLISLPYGIGISVQKLNYNFINILHYKIGYSTEIKINEETNFTFSKSPFIVLLYSSAQTKLFFTMSLNLSIESIHVLNATPVEVYLGDFAGPVQISLETPFASSDYPGPAVTSIAGSLADPFRLQLVAERNGGIVGVWNLTRKGVKLYLAENTSLILKYWVSTVEWIHTIYNIKIKQKSYSNYNEQYSESIVNIIATTTNYKYVPMPWNLPYRVEVNGTARSIELVIAPGAGNTYVSYDGSLRQLAPIDSVLPLENITSPKQLIAFKLNNLTTLEYSIPTRTISKSLGKYVLFNNMNSKMLSKKIGSDQAIICPGADTRCIVVYLNP